MTIAIEQAKSIWEEANRTLQEARKKHRKSPTDANRKALVAAANRWEKAASAWSAAIVADGDRDKQRAEFLKATTVKPLTGRA